MRKLQIGVVGCGAIGRQHIARLTNIVPEAEVAAVCDYVQDAAKAVATQYAIRFSPRRKS